ncbi:hypothetical protein QN239_24160 [Mycolicibacterium sp. Y3]
MNTDTSPESAGGLREELLYDGLSDWVSLADADSKAAKYCPDVPQEQRQELVLDTLYTLVAEDLFLLGHRDTPDDRFAAFAEPLDESMAKIRHICVDYYDTPIEWAFWIWLQLTDKGTAAVTKTERGREIARGVEEDVRRLAAQREQQ